MRTVEQVMADLGKIEQDIKAVNNRKTALLQELRVIYTDVRLALGIDDVCLPYK